MSCRGSLHRAAFRSRLPSRRSSAIFSNLNCCSIERLGLQGRASQRPAGPRRAPAEPGPAAPGRRNDSDSGAGTRTAAGLRRATTNRRPCRIQRAAARACLRGKSRCGRAGRAASTYCPEPPRRGGGPKSLPAHPLSGPAPRPHIMEPKARPPGPCAMLERCGGAAPRGPLAYSGPRRRVRPAAAAAHTESGA